MRKGIQITIILVLGLMGLGIGFLLLKRNDLLQKTLSTTIQKLRMEDGMILKIGSAQFTGLSEIKAEQISLVPEIGDSLLWVKEIRIGISIWPLLTGKIRIYYFIFG